MTSAPAPVAWCAGVPVCVQSRRAAVTEAVELAVLESDGHDIHLCSADTIVCAGHDPKLRQLLGSATRNLPDGMSLVLATRRSEGSSGERVAGTDFMRAVWNEGQAVGLRHYLLGSTPEVLQAAEAQLLSDYPDSILVGSESPPFRPQTDEEFDAQMTRIRDCGAQIVWVGLGGPKQDWAVARMAAHQKGVFVAVGAAFDFIAGSKKRAPLWMQANGLEWAFRLGVEPRRMWRRYLIGLPRFAWYLSQRSQNIRSA